MRAIDPRSTGKWADPSKRSPASYITSICFTKSFIIRLFVSTTLYCKSLNKDTWMNLDDVALVLMLARFKARTFSDLFQQLNQKYLVKPKIICKWQWFLHNKDLNSTLTNFVIMCVQLTHVPQENEQILLNESNKLYFIIMLHKNFIILLFVSITR